MSTPGPVLAGFLSRFSSCPCPTCGYELRVALESSEDGTVRCPECGNECDADGIERKLQPRTAWGWVLSIGGSFVPAIVFAFCLAFFLSLSTLPGVVSLGVSVFIALLVLAAFSYGIVHQMRAKDGILGSVLVGMFILAWLNAFALLVFFLVIVAATMVF